ncbi:MAG TPA: TMEM175 family protein [Chthoniobacterales bacterium]
MESFSDAVFGFALTLLVVSLDVPRNFADLINTMCGFPSFAICFVFLAIIWNSHYNFCRRYGLEDTTARVLTCVLLFLVLFYVYPLKFLFNFGVNSLFVPSAATQARLTLPQYSVLMTIYGLGLAAVYLALVLLYLHAYRLRDALGLNDLERLDTRFQILRHSCLIVIGLLGALLAQFRAIVGWSACIYFALFPILRAHRIVHRRKRAPLLPATPDR